MNQLPYQLPNAPRNTGGADWKAIAWGLAFFACCQVAITQTLAFYFLFQSSLGRPSVFIGPFPIYPPWQWMVWAFRFIASHDERIQKPFFVAMICGAVSVLLMLFVIQFVVARNTRKINAALGNLHGAARFAEDKDIAESPLLESESGVIVGGWEESPGNILILRDDSDGHNLGLAQTGSGKTAGLVLPTVLSNPDRSLMLWDPKGELHQLSSGYRKACGNKVFLYNPVAEPGETCRFNILAEIRFESVRAVDDAEIVAHMFTHVPGEESQDPHWDDIAQPLIKGLILHEGYKAINEGRVVNCRDVARAVKPPDRQFADVLQEMMEYEHDPTGRFGWTFRNSEGRIVPTKINPVVMASAMAMLDRTTDKGPTEEYTSCLSSAQKRFEIYESPLIINATSKSDFTIDQLVNHESPVTLYITIPLGHQRRLKHLVRTIFTMMFSRLTEKSEAERRVNPNKHKFIWIIDEFPTLGRLDIFKDMMPLARGYGIKIFLIAQNVKQILDAYGQYESISGNCDTLSAYTPAGADKDTAEALSEMTGKMTVLHESASYSGQRYSATKSSITTHVEKTQRALMTPDDIRALRAPKKRGNRVVEPGQMLIFQTGQRPILGRQTLYWMEPLFLERSQLPEVRSWPSIVSSGVRS